LKIVVERESFMGNCKCGSGLPKVRCHNEDNINKIRKSLRVSFISNETDIVRTTTFFPLRSVDFPIASYRGVLKFQIATTPAGPLIYPLFIKKEGSCLRPLTIDGQLIINDGIEELVSIPCMLTPIHFGEIIFHSKDVKRDNFSIGGYTVKCEIRTKGNPFESVFAMEMKGEQIALYHHTSKENEKLILESGYFKGSKWNFQGTNELTTFHNIYLTNIPKIEDKFDLFEIGMCDKGTDLSIITDDNEIEVIEVYRENPCNRPAALKVWVDWNLISTNHLILHNDKASHFSPTQVGTFSWWEVFMPYIFRVPVKINSYLRYTYNRKKNEYRLKYGPNYYKTNGFYAALGTDLHGLKVIWSEISTPRPKSRQSDYGRLDDEWVKIWENNFTKLVHSTLENLLLKNT
jgi:hypothetical protein